MHQASYRRPWMAPNTPHTQVTAAAMTTRPRYHRRNLFESGKLEAASTTRKPTTIGSRRALTICAQTVSQMRFGASQTNAAPPSTHAA
jgi:hypothetical protein